MARAPSCINMRAARPRRPVCLAPCARAGFGQMKRPWLARVSQLNARPAQRRIETGVGDMRLLLAQYRRRRVRNEISA